MLGSNSNGDFALSGGGGGSDASVFFPGLWTIYASREKAALGWRARSLSYRAGPAGRQGNREGGQTALRMNSGLRDSFWALGATSTFQCQVHGRAGGRGRSPVVG